MKMTGGDCHDTLMPFPVPIPGPVPLPLPNPASSGPTGILTGAVAWNMDNHPAKARIGHDRKVEWTGKVQIEKDRRIIHKKRDQIRSREGISPPLHLKCAFISTLIMHEPQILFVFCVKCEKQHWLDLERVCHNTNIKNSREETWS